MTAEPIVGLSTEQVRQRVGAGQVNSLPERSGRSTREIVRDNVFTRVNAILFILFVVVMSTGAFEQGIFGLLIIANSIIGIIQELRAKRTLDSLAVIGEAHPRVLRDGTAVQLPRDEVVRDDVILVGPGDQVVVDGRVVHADYLEVDESMLTGEADPVTKLPGDEVLSGAFVVAGAGKYTAQRVGAEAYAAQITAQAAKFTLVRSELRRGIDRIIRFVSFLLVPVAALTIWVQFQQEGNTWQESVLRMTAALVPMIPEGLVLLTSMAFALGVVRLGRRNCLVQEMPAIEGLARVSVVCTDKTGTLTQHAMSLGEIIPLADSDPAEVARTLGQLAAADPTPNASMQAIAETAPAPDEPWEVVARAPFTSARKFSGASFAGHGDWVIGAADMLVSGEVAERAESMGATGRRVLLLARSRARVDSAAAPGEVVPVALLVLDQMLRPDASETLDYFTRQGVDVKVISGDNAASVGAVSRSLGMRGGDAVDARTLPQEDEVFADAVAQGSVFGRVTPQQKRRMVGALQSRGHTVAMTGDGVNDVLALKDAELGVAMGSGSSATRAVAQIVLLDDRFETLPHVVAEGRRVIGNVERVAKLFLTKTVYAVALALVLGVLGLPNPFVPLQITVIGWFTIGIPAFLLSLAPNHDRARTGFVRRVLAVGVPSGVIVAAATITAFLITRGGFGEVSEVLEMQSSTATLSALIITAVWVVSIVARPFVAWRLAMVVFGYAFYTAMFLWPPTQRLLTLDVRDPGIMAVGLVTGLAGALAIEATWWVTAAIRHERPRLWRRPSART